MESNILISKLSSFPFVEISRCKDNYLYLEGLMNPYIYILKEGVLKLSCSFLDGREFNLKYINHCSLVSLCREEDQAEVSAPFNLKVVSDQAVIYQIDRLQFWQHVYQDDALLEYIRIYYRTQLDYFLKKMKWLSLNNRKTILILILLELSQQFGEVTEEGILIRWHITYEELANFCGISGASSTYRLIKELKESGFIDFVDHFILLKDMEGLKACSLGC